MNQRGRKSAAKQAISAYDRTRSANNRASSSRELAPPHLSDATKAWWEAIVAEYGLSGPELYTLRIACEAWDRKEQARQALTEHGLSYEDNKGMLRQRPEAAIERDSAIRFMRAMRELNFGDVEPPDRNKNCLIGMSWRQMQQQSRGVPYDDVED
jgi:phage terminase small subunit